MRAAKKGFMAVLLLGATVALFWPMTGNDFVFDDQGELLVDRNAAGSLNKERLTWAVTSTEFSLYVPLTRLSVLLDFQIYGKKPFGHHLTGLLLHGANSALVFLALAALTGAPWRSAAVAALCAVHPLRVEPAAWISGRADLLAALFALSALLAWERYLRTRGRAWAALASAAALFGMLSKPIVMTLPFALLLLDFWPLGRVRVPGRGDRPASVPASARLPGSVALLREKAGLFLAVGVLIVVTLFVLQQGSLVVPAERYPLPARVLNSVTAYAFYVDKTLWPAGLTVFYPHRWGAIAWWESAGALALLAALSAAALGAPWRRPHLAVGWLWFVGTLLPVIGLYQTRQYPVADRYAYLPQIGLFVMAIWSLERLGRGRRGGTTAAAGACLALIALCVPLSRAQVQHWKNNESLFRHTIAVTEGNWLAYNNLGVALAARGQVDEAVGHFRRALAIKPGYAEAHYNFGVVLKDLGFASDAIAHYRRALAIRPDYVEARVNLGNELDDGGRPEEAIAEYRQALAIRPDHADAHFNFGVALAKLGRLDEASARYRRVLEIQPGHAHALRELEATSAALRARRSQP